MIRANIRCPKNILCMNSGKMSTCFSESSFEHENCADYDPHPVRKPFNREEIDDTAPDVPKEVTFEFMSKLNLAELKQLKQEKLAEFASVHAEKEILMGNIMSIQKMINKEQSKHENDSSN